jgi:hypothetical protein
VKSSVAYIKFAVEQQRAAEKFGFTRNECCRNLKTALHQYWQNKTMGLHGQSQKKRIPRSVAATGLPLAECVVEHAVPQMEIVNRLMGLNPLTEEAIESLLRRLFVVTLVTKAEHALLNASGVRSTMPEGWDGKNVYARYEAVGIRMAGQ